jgi:broad specificity phosphatase PhoE
MNVVRYKENEIPPLTPDYEAKAKALAERLAIDDSGIDCSDIPELDEFDFKYAITRTEYQAMSKSERNEYFHAALAAKEADRAAKKAQQEVERAIVKARHLARQT